MKKYLFSALALGMMLTSCQSDEPFAPGEGGEKQVTFTLNVPGDLGTRSGATDNNSGVGGFSNSQGSLYYTLVLHANGDTQILKNANATISNNGKTATFTPTVVLGRDYTITAYASFDDNASINNKADIEAITVSKNFNDESKDVYFYTTTHNFAGDNLETLELKRPFGKLRLVATDYKAEGNGNTAIKSVRVKYNNNVFTTFNAVSGEFSGGKSYEYTLEGTDYSTSYYAPEKDENGNVTGQTIFADYIPVQKNGDHAAPFEITVEYNDGETYTREFTQDIPVRRNALTTLKGNFFTAGAEITVTVDDAFDVNMEDFADGVFKDVNGNYYISNANGLKWVASEVNKYSNYEHPFEEETIYLLNDIDLGGMEWTPIGDYRFSANRFCGTFDGQGHTISNFKITKKTDKNDSNKSSYGFFGNLEGTVKNLTIAYATVNSYAYTGALVGRLNSGLIENCHVISSTVSNTYWQGGILIGQVNGEGNNPVVKNCSVKNSSIKSKSAIGAIAGPVTATKGTATEGAATFEECYVENCQVIQEGSFGGSYDNYFGSMFGYLETDADSRIDINNCSVKNVTVKGEDNAPISGDFDGNIYVNGGQPVATATELAAAIQAGGSYTLVNDIAMTEAIAISNANFTLDGNGKTITMTNDATNTYALFDITGGKATFKNVTFDGVKTGAVVRTVGVEFNAENVTAQNGNHTQVQGLFRLMGKSTIKNCTFKNNTCSMVITLNYDGNNNDPQMVENCVFEGNTCNGTAVLYYVKGAGATINRNKFIGNTVNCNKNGATVYMGFTENNVITNNLFKNNTVNEATTSKRVAGGLMIGYAAVVTGNAFIGNTVNATNAKGNDVCASVYYTDIDLSGNYWGGNAPVENDDYFIEYPDMHNVIINDYLTANPIK